MSLYTAATTLPVYGTFIVVGIVLTCLRFWVRLSFSRTHLGLDDVFIVIGAIVVTACTGIQLYNSIGGTAGEAISPAEAEEVARISIKVDFTMLVIEKLAFGAIKLSLLFFYRRIFGAWPSFKLIDSILIVLVAIWTLTFFLADLLLCGTNIEVNWALDQSRGLSKCGDKGALLIAFTATSVLTDALVLGLPLLYIPRLQMPKKRKWMTSFVILLGAVSTLAGILRLIFLCISYPMGRLTWGYEAPPNEETPLVLDVFNPSFWVMVEMLLGLWAANLPALTPILRTISFHKIGSRVYRSLTTLSGGNGSKSGSRDFDSGDHRVQSDQSTPVIWKATSLDHISRKDSATIVSPINDAFPSVVTS